MVPVGQRAYRDFHPPLPGTWHILSLDVGVEGLAERASMSDLDRRTWRTEPSAASADSLEQLVTWSISRLYVAPPPHESGAVGCRFHFENDWVEVRMAIEGPGLVRGNVVSDVADAVQFAAVNAQLETTIRVLRTELEQERVRGESAIREAHAEAAGEIAGLKQTIEALRGRLEQGQKAGDEAIQSVRAAASREIAELQATIVALRAELEAERTHRGNEASEREQTFARERVNLEDQIRALRARLETAS